MHNLYNHMANKYDRWYTTPKGRISHQIEKKAVYAYLKPQKGQSLLDIGCGTGQYSLDLASMGLEVTGVDISRAMLDQARAKAADSVFPANFIEADAMNLPFPDESFDLVLSVTALEFVPDLPRALKEAFRVLKKGGRLVVGLIGRHGPWHSYYAEKARRNPASVFKHARFYSLDELLVAMLGKQIQGKAVLFVPPSFNFDNEQAALALEDAGEHADRRTDGGFICAVSTK
ncbi:MAG TPA: class I SAM-dependent methyltransferase [Clostridia bacterium]|nr:class I SAM-dependent methyltransferase [Clostridia bacterium]